MLSCLRSSRPVGEKHVAADQIKQDAKNDERNQGEQVRIWAIEKRVVDCGPMLDVLAHIDETRHTGHERNHDAGDGCERKIWTDQECLTCGLPCAEGLHCAQGGVCL